MMTVGRIVQFLDKRAGHPYWMHRPAEVEKALEKLAFARVAKIKKRFGLGASVYIIDVEEQRAC